MIIYDWSRGSFGGVCSFAASEDGYRDFESYLQESGFKPVHILVDLIEEEFSLWATIETNRMGNLLEKYQTANASQ